MATIIKAVELTKDYGGNRGVMDLTFEVAEGEVFGFLGPNGAGKSTTIRLFMGLLRPTAGQTTIAGFDCWRQATAVKRLAGYLPGEWTFDAGLTGAQILEYLANLRGGVDRAYVRRLIERFELDPSRRFREYSHGNKQKIGLIQAFMSRPRLLVLDEPTIGLDPLNQREFYAMVAEARAAGQTIFLSSHILAEVERTCDRVGIVREGHLVTVDTVANLKEIKAHAMDISFSGPASPDWFAGLPGVLSATLETGGRAVRLMVQGETREVIQAAAAHGATNIATYEPSLEEIFLRFYTPRAPRAPSAPLQPGAPRTLAGAGGR
ncbi:MAG TPA: ABC transporter ATP-binding protein [Ktedonobacterales bacterium]|nr:ABC transporter ATP-binding protein [Ktedonobacterales bacterium]